MILKKRGLRSSRTIKEKKRRFIIRLILIVSAGVFLVTGFSFLSFLPEMTITSISITGTKLVSKGSIHEYSSETITRRYWGFFSTANSFLYPKNKIKEGLLDRFPELSQVTLSLYGLQSLTINVKERKPFALWCGEQLPEEKDDSSTCYFLDRDGIIFAPERFFLGSIFFKVYGPIEGDKIRTGSLTKKPLGFLLIEKQRYQRFIEFAHVLKAMKLEVNTLVMQENGDAFFVLENKIKILFHKEQNFQNLLENFESVLDTEQLKLEDFIGEETSLEYIDLRFNKRVFFKFK